MIRNNTSKGSITNNFKRIIGPRILIIIVGVGGGVGRGNRGCSNRVVVGSSSGRGSGGSKSWEK